MRVDMTPRLQVAAFTDMDGTAGSRVKECVAVDLDLIPENDFPATVTGRGHDVVTDVDMLPETHVGMCNGRTGGNESLWKDVSEERPSMIGSRAPCRDPRGQRAKRSGTGPRQPGRSPGLAEAITDCPERPTRHAG